jgi:hypothetical protein
LNFLMIILSLTHSILQSIALQSELLGHCLTIPDSVIMIMAVLTLSKCLWLCDKVHRSIVCLISFSFLYQILLQKGEPLDTQLNTLLLNLLKGYWRTKGMQSHKHSEIQGSGDPPQRYFNPPECPRIYLQFC